MNKHTPELTQLEFPLDETAYFPPDLENYAPWVAEYGLRAPYGECQCGCKRETTMYGKHWRRYLKGHHKTVYTKSITQRFWEKIDKSASNGCWLWTGHRERSGYGMIALVNPRKNLRAHRVSWQLHYGPIPDGLFVCHHCDNPPCCNPKHLFLGTQLDNLRDMQNKGRRGVYDRNGEHNPRAKLTEKQVVEIRERVAGGESRLKLAELYGVTFATIGHIIRRFTWKHI